MVVCVQVFRKNWMFRLVGCENFMIGKRSALISISSNGLTFEYVLTIDGKSLKKFVEAQNKNTRVWLPELSGCGHRVVLGMLAIAYMYMCVFPVTASVLASQL